MGLIALAMAGLRFATLASALPFAVLGAGPVLAGAFATFAGLMPAALSAAALFARIVSQALFARAVNSERFSIASAIWARAGCFAGTERLFLLSRAKH